MAKKAVNIVDFGIKQAAAETFVTEDQARRVILSFLTTLNDREPDRQMLADSGRFIAYTYAGARKFFAGPKQLIEHLIERTTNAG